MRSFFIIMMSVASIYANTLVANCTSRSSSEANVEWTKFDCEGDITGRYSLQELYRDGWRAKVSYRDNYSYIIFEKETSNQK